MTTLADLKKIVAELCDDEPDGLTADSKFRDMGIDSLTGLELLFMVETKWQVVFDDIGPDNMPATIGGLAALIDTRLAAARARTASAT